MNERESSFPNPDYQMGQFFEKLRHMEQSMEHLREENRKMRSDMTSLNTNVAQILAKLEKLPSKVEELEASRNKLLGWAAGAGSLCAVVVSLGLAALKKMQ